MNVNDANKWNKFNTTNESDDDFTEIKSVGIGNKAHDCKDCFSSIFAEDYIYNLHWVRGLDWDHLLLYIKILILL